MNASRLLPLLLLTGCASITPLAYTAQPGRITDPRAEVKTFIEANTTGGCVTTAEFNQKMLIVKYVCQGGGIGNSVARFDRVESVTMDQSGEWYRAVLHHKGGGVDFSWTSKSLEDTQRFADALSALSQPSNAAPVDSTSM